MVAVQFQPIPVYLEDLTEKQTQTFVTPLTGHGKLPMRSYL